MKVLMKIFVLFLLYIGVLGIVGCSQEIEMYDAPPVIMFQNAIYGTGGNPSEYSSFHEESRVYEGEVKSATKNGETPTENFQSNEGGYIGCPIYTSRDIPNYIFVLSVDAEGLNHYSIFKKLEWFEMAKIN